MEVKIEKIDFKKLKNQKQILINMIQDWGEADDPQQKSDANDVEGLLSLIDSIQDYERQRIKRTKN